MVRENSTSGAVGRAGDSGVGANGRFNKTCSGGHYPSRAAYGRIGECGNRRGERHDMFRGFRLPRSRLATDDHRLVRTVLNQVLQRARGLSMEMGVVYLLGRDNDREGTEAISCMI